MTGPNTFQYFSKMGKYRVVITWFASIKYFFYINFDLNDKKRIRISSSSVYLSQKWYLAQNGSFVQFWAQLCALTFCPVLSIIFPIKKNTCESGYTVQKGRVSFWMTLYRVQKCNIIKIMEIFNHFWNESLKLITLIINLWYNESFFF